MDVHAHKSARQRRVLIVDDTESIHRDFEKVLLVSPSSESEMALDELESLMFEDHSEPSASTSNKLAFELEHAYQGEEGLSKVVQAKESGAPLSVAFIDMRMPPGWDGLKTAERIWQVDPDIQLVICSAYSDYSWSQIVERLGHSDRLLILKKPFDHAEVYQLATALSEKWQAERSTRELLASLEEKVKRRTGELSGANKRLHALNEELQVAVEEARSSERAKGRFLATMSHEIRTSLNGIIGASHLLNNSADLTSADREFAQIIQSSGDTLMIVINDILDYSKYENGQLELESIPFSLLDLAHDCGSLLDTVIQNNRIDFSIECDAKLPSVLVGDPARIRQVLLNLLNNAFKFGKNGAVLLALKVEQSDEQVASLSIEVSDHGIGMGPETLERLFSAFMQADSSTTREYGGTGLGLAICKLLADAMSGKIVVTSEIGQGATFAFRLTLPICQPTGGAGGANALVQSGGQKSDETRDFGGKRVLLVDDNAINRKLGKHFLERMNLMVELAANGKEAVEQFVAQRFDMVLMDLQMPEMDGIEATRLIREQEATRKSEAGPVPIVALTANAFNEVREECRQGGMDDFLTKPLRIKDLTQILDQWLMANEGARSEP